MREVVRSRIANGSECGDVRGLYCELLREAVVDEVPGNMPGVDDELGRVDVPLGELAGVEGVMGVVGDALWLSAAAVLDAMNACRLASKLRSLGLC